MLPDNIQHVLRAADFAARRHCNQRRKDYAASPYINHPLNVAEILANQAGCSDTELLVAALLHDTVEDTNTTLDEIRAEFGDVVEGLVKEVTDDKSLPKLERKRLQVETAPSKSERAKQLKIADKICNIADICDDSPVGWDAGRKAEYLDWAEQVVAGCRGVNQKLEQLFDETLAAARDRLT